MAYDEDTIEWARNHAKRLRQYAEMARKRAVEFEERARRVDQVYGLVKSTPIPIGNGRQDCEWCLGDPQFCDGSECEK